MDGHSSVVVEDDGEAAMGLSREGEEQSEMRWCGTERRGGAWGTTVPRQQEAMGSDMERRVPEVGSDGELGREPGSRGGEVWRWGQAEEEQG